MVDLVNGKEQVVFGNDSIVIQKFIAGIKGGRALDVTGYTESVIKAGHVIIASADGVYKPMLVSGEAYAALPESHTIKGILVSSILTSKPMAAIMTIGQVNSEALPYAVPAGFADACPHIELIKDEESK